MDNSISKEAIEELPLGQFSGVITVIEQASDVPGIVKLLQKERCLGFDTETRPSFKKGESNSIALLQISTEQEAFLFRLNKTGMHPAIIQLFENKAILKIGVGIRDDLRGLN